MRALVVDDSRAIRSVIARMLRGMGYAVAEAGNGREALDHLATTTPTDLALLDWNMPVMDGFALLCELRRDPGYAVTRIMMVTTETEIERMMSALQAGADEYLMKPFTPDALREKLGLLGLAVAASREGRTMSPSLDPVEYQWLCAFLRAESALSIDESKEYLVNTRLAPVLKEFGLPTLSALVAKLKLRPMNAAHQRVIEAMTTNETSFFRDIHPFDTLRNNILPELVKRRGSAPLNIWCAAASTGQEPYTIAMILRESFPDVAARTKIFCTDINTLVLERTKRGIYSQLEVNRGLPAAMLVKYFERKGSEWQVKEELRRMIETRVMNLAIPWSGVPPMDIVFIRNVLIYFDVDIKKAIVGRIRRNMPIDGFLFVGGAETLINVDNDFARTTAGKSTLYKRAA